MSSAAVVIGALRLRYFVWLRVIEIILQRLINHCIYQKATQNITYIFHSCSFCFLQIAPIIGFAGFFSWFYLQGSLRMHNFCLSQTITSVLMPKYFQRDILRNKHKTIRAVVCQFSQVFELNYSLKFLEILAGNFC